LTEYSTQAIILILVCLILLSAFFSISETAIFSLNRIKLKSLAHSRKRSAILVAKLLKRPDRLMGLILIGNNAVNILTAIVGGILFSRFFGAEHSILATTLILTFIMLIFAELTPKTYAAVHPQRVAFFNVYPLSVLMVILKWPIVFINWISNAILKTCLRIDPTQLTPTHLSQDDIKTALTTEQNTMISSSNKNLLLNAMELESVNVEEIMIHTTDIYAIDLNAKNQVIIDSINQSPFTRLPVYSEQKHNILGVLHLRDILPYISDNRNKNHIKKKIEKLMRPALFINEYITLAQQLLSFKQKKERMGFVVNEYGEVQGLITIDNLLEQIVGEFTTNDGNYRDAVAGITKNKDGSIVVTGNTPIREINKTLNAKLNDQHATTINGFLLEYLQQFPQGVMGCQIDNLCFEILEFSSTSIDKIHILKNKKLTSQP